MNEPPTEHEEAKNEEARKEEDNPPDPSQSQSDENEVNGGKGVAEGVTPRLSPKSTLEEVVTEFHRAAKEGGSLAEMTGQAGSRGMKRLATIVLATVDGLKTKIDAMNASHSKTGDTSVGTDSPSQENALLILAATEQEKEDLKKDIRVCEQEKKFLEESIAGEIAVIKGLESDFHELENKHYGLKQQSKTIEQDLATLTQGIEHSAEEESRWKQNLEDTHKRTTYLKEEVNRLQLGNEQLKQQTEVFLKESRGLSEENSRMSVARQKAIALGTRMYDAVGLCGYGDLLETGVTEEVIKCMISREEPVAQLCKWISLASVAAQAAGWTGAEDFQEDALENFIANVDVSTVARLTRKLDDMEAEPVALHQEKAEALKKIELLEREVENLKKQAATGAERDELESIRLKLDEAQKKNVVLQEELEKNRKQMQPGNDAGTAVNPPITLANVTKDDEKPKAIPSQAPTSRKEEITSQVVPTPTREDVWQTQGKKKKPDLAKPTEPVEEEYGWLKEGHSLQIRRKGQQTTLWVNNLERGPKTISGFTNKGKPVEIVKTGTRERDRLHVYVATVEKSKINFISVIDLLDAVPKRMPPAQPYMQVPTTSQPLAGKSDSPINAWQRIPSSVREAPPQSAMGYGTTMGYGPPLIQPIQPILPGPIYQTQHSPPIAPTPRSANFEEVVMEAVRSTLKSLNIQWI